MKGTTGLALCAVLSALLASPVAAATHQRGTAAGKPGASASTSQAGTTRHAQATSRTRQAVQPGTATRPATARGSRDGRRYAEAGSGGGISCVPYARMVTGMQISGNGGHWWHNAAGTYDRGNRPEPGSILAFPASGGMRSGHVAVVSRVHGPRHIEIDHANWGGPGIRRGTVMRNVDVIDVSERNDWTAVRVQVGWEQGAFGRTYPTYGFIHNRPERGMMAAFTGGAVGTARAQPVASSFEQVAELPRTAPTRRAASRTR
ncbi:MAG: CHAP domain-containing protein [Acetobacteraceae bacterium]|nr:CHAP domain-containing protein [Acetobacteraceae bacterium]